MSAEEQWVDVQGYAVSWPLLFEQEAAEITKTLGGFASAVEHFGSTAVPGLVAKPIVDILVGTGHTDVDATVVTALGALGYEFLGEDGRRPGRFFFRKRGPHAFNLSIVPMGGDLWSENLRVRDFLRAHPDWAARYAEVKQEALLRSPQSMLGYQDHKRDFVELLKQHARAWGEDSRVSH